MKEFLKNKWYIILGLILLIASVVVSVILYIKLDECSNKKCKVCEPCEEVKCEEEIEPEEDETYSFVSIVKADEFGVPYDYNETSDMYKALKNGYLTGDWYVEELKDIKFIGTVGVPVDTGNPDILALSETGEIYEITPAWDEELAAEYQKLNTEITGKITKMGNMLITPENHDIPFSHLDITVLTIDDSKCVLDVTIIDDIATYICNRSLEEYFAENPTIFSVGHYAYAEGIGLDYAKVDNNHYITFQGSDDKLTNILDFTPIKVEYTIYTVNEDNKEVLYIVSSDNKLYIVDNVDSTNLMPYDDIKSVEYENEKLDYYGSTISGKKISIVLSSGQELVFEEA